MNSSVLDSYDPHGFYCEMLQSAASRVVRERLSGLSIDALKQRAGNANAELYNLGDRKSTRLNSSHSGESRMPSSA